MCAFFVPSFPQNSTKLVSLRNTINDTFRLYPVVLFNVCFALKDTVLLHGGGPDSLSPIGGPKTHRLRTRPPSIL
jgi:hypothetical protein